MKIITHIIFVALVALSFVNCGRKQLDVPCPANAVYYWRTSFTLCEQERAFLKEHHIGKLYLRFFDVVSADSMPHPNATLLFTDSIPNDLEVIPTVFITEDCMHDNTEQLPQLLVKRVLQMCETRDVPNVHELQIDCDWTKNSQDVYFKFLAEVRELLKEKGMRLSVTIRLHQLRMTPPPADYGVLMMYNTGNVQDRQCENPILDIATVNSYLPHLDSYDLPLCAAYPSFGWKLHFRGNDFKCIYYDADLADTTQFRRTAPDTYLSLASNEISMGPTDDRAVRIIPGDEVLVRNVPFGLLKKVHDTLSQHREGINSQVIFFDLSTENINRYNSQQYETIYHP